MNKFENIKFILKMTTYYPKYYNSFNEMQMKLLTESWYELINDIPIEIAIACLKRYVSVNKWPPTISDIRHEYSLIKDEEIETDGEAWKKAMKLVKKNYSGPGVSTGAFDDLGMTEEIILATKSIGLESIFMSQNIGVERSNFLKIYNQIKERKIKENVLPDKIKLENLKNKYITQSKEQNKIVKIESKNKKNNNENNINFKKRLEILKLTKKRMTINE